MLAVGYEFKYSRQLQMEAWVDKYAAGWYNLDDQQFIDVNTPWQPSSYDDTSLVNINVDDYILSQYRTAWAYNKASKTWRKLKDLKSVGKRHSSVVVGDQVYICGGCGCAENRSCEYWSSYQPNWQHTSRMKRNRYDHCATQYNGHMYVFGGRLLQTNVKLTEVEVYTPSNDSWHDGSTTMPEYTKCSAILHNDYIYVCGYNTGYSSQCIKYNPRDDTHKRAGVPFDSDKGASVETLGLLSEVAGQLYWMDNARGVYTFDDDANKWTQQALFNVEEANLPEDMEPRAVVGV